MGNFRYCPECRRKLVPRKEDGLLACPSVSCDFVHYDNPKPAVAVLIPMGDGIVLVKRGVEPFVGSWCMPCGYVNRYSHPKAEAARETFEETGLIIRVERILSQCNPSQEEYPLNIITTHFLGRADGGELQAGDDAIDIGLFTMEDMPPVCFRSHRMVIEEWFNGKWGGITGIDL